jgi:hypothetical protein
MSESKSGEKDPGNDRGIYQDFANPSHDGGQEPNGAASMEPPVTHSPTQQGQVGAPPIRWAWWAVGLAVSVGMWWAIAAVFGWI